MSVNILLADDHLMVREGLKQVLELDHDIDVISEASDGYECLNLINKTHPDVVLLDINMPNLDGLQVLSIMKQQKMKSKVIMLTIHKDVDYLIEALDAGCDGYVLKDSDSETLKKAIFDVYNGETFIEPSLTVLLNSSLAERDVMKDKLSELTKREVEVLKLIASGMFNKEIDTLYKSGDFNCIVSIVNSHIDKLEAVFAKNPQTQHKEIETVKKYIYTHFGDELGVEQLADMVYLAPSYLSTVFKKETGQNLSKFIKQYRMEKAKDMLENTNMKIVNISEACGYQNVSYFCQSFRECYGVSPQKFRNGI